ncbi:MAG: hypothetical protein OEM81_10960 [Acidimicrobiia bacterium]|nr:hypothetical protein [Acidimicrobiia bacterium]
MSRNLRRDLKADHGASSVEYSLAVVLIGLAAVLVTSFVGQATSDVFDEVGNAFPTDSLAAPLGDLAVSDGFDDFISLVDSLDGAGKSLVNKARAAKSSYLDGDVEGALSKLDSLVKEVDALAGNKLTVGQAATIRGAVDELVQTIGPG